MNGYIIEISSPDGDTDTMYWAGTDTAPTANEAAFYSTRDNAKYDSKDLVTRFIESDIRVIPATKTITVTR